MFICLYVHVFITVLDLDHRGNGDLYCVHNSDAIYQSSQWCKTLLSHIKVQSAVFSPVCLRMAQCLCLHKCTDPQNPTSTVVALHLVALYFRFL